MESRKLKTWLIDIFEIRIDMLPSTVTLGNAFCGFAFIVLALGSYARGDAIPVASAWLLVGALLCDALDGMLARKLDAASLHGANLDSLADAVSFGAAPAVAIFIFLRRTLPDGGPWSASLAWAASFIYLGCTLWRLARYNAMAITGEKEDDCFVGFPSPVAACMIYSAGLFLARIHFSPMAIYLIALIYAVLIGLMMVSYVPYPHMRRCVAGKPPLLVAAFGLLIFMSVIKFGLAGVIAWSCFLLLSAPVAEHFARKRPLKPVLILIFTSFGRRFRR